MFKFNFSQFSLQGETGSLSIKKQDDVALKLLMLMEGECSRLGPLKAAKKYGFSKQRYYQLLHDFQTGGTAALQKKKTGPQRNYLRSDEVVRQVIRYRFLNPEASVDVIVQKLRQTGFLIGKRSVQRVIEGYGLQKKTLCDES